MSGLQKIWQLWKKFGQLMGDIIGRLVLTIFYFTLFLPFGLGVRLGGDPLGIRRKHGSEWMDRSTHDLALEDARRLS